MKESAAYLQESEQWHHFSVLAEEYCSLIENDAVRGRAGLENIRGALLDLYGAACKLPQVHSEDATPESIGHDEWQALYRRLRERLGDHDQYWDSFNPLIKANDDLIASSLADDLADIWRDLKAGLRVPPTDSTEAIRAALWEWRFAFETHWGTHAIGALRALHYILLQDI